MRFNMSKIQFILLNIIFNGLNLNRIVHFTNHVPYFFLDGVLLLIDVSVRFDS